MFDAKNLLESLVRGASDRNAPAEPGTMPHGDPLSDLLQSLTRSDTSSATRAASPSGPDSTPAQPGTSGNGDLASILNNLGGGSGTGGGLAEILGNVLGQATSGVREGAGKIDQSTGLSDTLSDAIRQLSGKPPEEILARVREMVSSNQLGTGAVLGGLGGLLLGTETGRSVAANAAKIGAIALIGGLAYKAYQNYQAGRPLITGAGEDASVAPPPAGSGFEPEAVSNGETLTLIRTMVASAAADGRIGTAEQDLITGHLKEGGLDAEAEEFLASELNHPASIDDIAATVNSKEEASRVYTAARLAIDQDTPEEREFLNRLATRLHLEPELAAHIDAAARQAA